ncbi:hypothetical protein F5B22DRAFT_327388 [Xylaria bambusicola]|uniref:uncharacterized protein n=1 Tax=Xylaria bambusicola TaxID=326684 RepID=UPI002007251D|nr:uncharacterized protein F5B22DRAFT_327388 [Xylaria bambusicola]KAI0509374.1 hypothetical protein F5B22DRAFT_327388 [Xylaria bambusicola]
MTYPRVIFWRILTTYLTYLHAYLICLHTYQNLPKVSGDQVIRPGSVGLSRQSSHAAYPGVRVRGINDAKPGVPPSPVARRTCMQASKTCVGPVVLITHANAIWGLTKGADQPFRAVPCNFALSLIAHRASLIPITLPPVRVESLTNVSDIPVWRESLSPHKTLLFVLPSWLHYEDSVPTYAQPLKPDDP